jgi:hypothetical protein
MGAFLSIVPIGNHDGEVTHDKPRAKALRCQDVSTRTVVQELLKLERISCSLLLRRALDETGCPQSDLAVAAGVDNSSVSNWLDKHNDQTPPLPRLRLAKKRGGVRVRFAIVRYFELLLEEEDE